MMKWLGTREKFFIGRLPVIASLIVLLVVANYMFDTSRGESVIRTIPLLLAGVMGKYSNARQRVRGLPVLRRGDAVCANRVPDADTRMQAVRPYGCGRSTARQHAAFD
jgi:hypothetical protein